MDEELDDMDIEMFSDDSEEDLDRFGSTPNATDCIEELVASFLFQLSRPPGSKPRASSDTETEPEDAPAAAKRTPVELRVADRRGEGALRTMRFPAKRANGSARPFAQLFRVLDLTHEAVVDGVPATKRDMYYRDVPLFKSQKVVDNLVDDLAATFELERADLNVRATSKGLVCGSGLVIHLNSGEEIHANDTEGALIPVGEDIKSFTVAEDVDWVLLVEKDASPTHIHHLAVFQTLCRVRLASHPGLPGRGIIITGKGYPDVATRQLVATLSACLPRRIPLLGVVDGDPYGLDILSVYKYGSRAMAHEAEKLAAPRVKYLGVFASELASYGVDRDELLPITKADEKKALTMLGRPIPAKWKNSPTCARAAQGGDRGAGECYGASEERPMIMAMGDTSSSMQMNSVPSSRAPAITALVELCDRERTTVAALRHLIAPIHTLPVELLAEIFLLTIRDDMMLHIKDAFRIAHVCSDWRRVANSTPRLWTGPIDVDLRSDDLEEVYADGLNAWLARSAPLPIPISLQYTDWSKNTSSCITKEVLRIASRLRSVGISDPMSVSFVRQLAACRLDSLEELDLGVIYDKEQEISDPNTMLLFSTVPRLRKLHMNLHPNSTQIVMPWAQLTDLNIIDASSPDTDGVQPLCPRLHHLVLEEIIDIDSEDVLARMIASRWWTDTELAAHSAPPAVARWTLVKTDYDFSQHCLDILKDLPSDVLICLPMS
ncbi:Spo11/DNA topoisomerase VI subunit A [Mycena leptocephala]|nr:Spo11/DNA topoisomerase VI subunit A [Mycena leptocephala]